MGRCELPRDEDRNMVGVARDDPQVLQLIEKLKENLWDFDHREEDSGSCFSDSESLCSVCLGISDIRPSSTDLEDGDDQSQFADLSDRDSSVHQLGGDGVFDVVWARDQLLECQSLVSDCECCINLATIP